jgi:5-methylthioribose kinase
MSSFVPLLTGFLRRGRERRDLESEREFTLTQDVLQQKATEKTELAVQKLRNAGDLEEQALQNNATLSKVILDNYMDNNKDYLSFGGTDMTKKLLGLVNSGEFDTKPIDSNAIKEDYTFRFSKPDKDNPVKFLADVQGAITTNPDKFNTFLKIRMI